MFAGVSTIHKLGGGSGAMGGLNLLRSTADSIIVQPEGDLKTSGATDDSLCRVSLLLDAASKSSISVEAGKEGLGLLNTASNIVNPAVALSKFVDTTVKVGKKFNKACVTGANGYLGAYIIQMLLSYGYTVIGTVRDTGDSDKTAHLTSLSGASDRLKIVKVPNLAEAGALDKAIIDEEVQVVFHVAFGCNPMLPCDDPETQMIKAASDITTNVLETCMKAKSVARVVLTSSLFAIDEWGMDEEHKNHYGHAKSKAEKAAFEFMQSKSPSFSLAAVHPGWTVGPMLQPHLNWANNMLCLLVAGGPDKTKKDLGIGGSDKKNWWMRIVDVRDVAMAHLIVAEADKASSRTPVVAQTMTVDHVCAVLRRALPEASIPTELCEAPQDSPSKYDTSCITSLGLSFRSPVCTLMETAADLKNKGFVTAKPAAVATLAAPTEAATRKVSLAPDPAKEEDLKSLFETFDMDGAGFITKDAFKDFYKSANNLLPDEEQAFDVMLSGCNEKGEENVTFAEFTKMMLKFKK